MTLQHTIQQCKNLDEKNITPLTFEAAQILYCDLSDIKGIFNTGVLPQKINGCSSISRNGIWQCIVLKATELVLIVYTAGHQSPMYISVTQNL